MSAVSASERRRDILAIARAAKASKRERELASREANLVPIQVERRYVQLRRDRVAIESCMRHMPYDGRPQLVRPTDVHMTSELVNGQEARASARWHRSNVERAQCKTIIVSSRRQQQRGSAAAIAAAIGGGREWSEFTPTRERRSKRTESRSKGIGAAEAYDRLIAAVGVVDAD